MMFLASTAEHDVVVSGEGRAIPDTIAIRAPTRKLYGVSGGGFGTSSGRTTLVYQWIRSGKSVANGTTSWPDAYHAADQHAADLLAIAEAGFEQGCPSAPLPAIPWEARADVPTRLGPAHAYFLTAHTPTVRSEGRRASMLRCCS